MRGLLAAALVAAAAQGILGISDHPDATIIRLDAIAADARGRLVEGLGAADFQVIEEGAPRQIESVQLVRADGEPRDGETLPPILSGDDERTEAIRAGTRLFVIFLDEYHVSAGSDERVRAALTDFVNRSLGPRDLALVVKPLDLLPNLRLTRDRNAVLQAIAAFDGRKGDYRPRTAFEKDYIAPEPPRVDSVRTQIVTSALNAIAVHLGTLSAGRKTLIVVSDGFVRPARRRVDPLPSLDTIVRSANRSGVSIYPIDPRAFENPDRSGQPDEPASVPPVAGEVDTLRMLATETDGQAVLAKADLSAGIQRIMRDSSEYYLIAFQPAHGESSGGFHTVEVRVTRPGVALRSRTGYWSPLPDTTVVLPKTAMNLQSSMQRHASPLIRPWFGVTRADDGKTRVKFVWEPAVRVPGDRLHAEPPVRVTLKVLNADGTSLFESVVRPADQFAANDSTDASGGSDGAVPAQTEFEVTPGTVHLQMAIADQTAKLLDTDVRDVIVRPLTGPVVLGTVQVLRARNAREFREIDSDPDPVPVATREFSRTERLLIRIPAYAAQGRPDVTARLASALGQVMRELTVTATPGSDLHEIDLPLSGLAPAEYRLELTAMSGDAKAQDSITFRVTP